MEHLIFEFLVRTTFIAAATGLILWMLRIGAAGSRHAVWVGMTLAMLLLPAWMAWGPKAGLPVLPAQPVPLMQVAAGAAAVVEETPVSLSAPVASARAERSRRLTEADALLGIYALGAGVLLLRLAIGTLRARRLRSADCSAPVTVGFFRPRIILPESAREWPQAQMDAVMTHEGAHASRRDPLFQWLALFNRAIFWFHPLAWWLERKLSALAEEACDAAVIERGHDPQEYSRTLLELARAVQQAGTRANVVAMAMPGSYLPHRVKKIIAGIHAPKVSRARMACAAFACAIPAALFAAGTLEHAPQLLPLWPLPARAAAPAPPVLIAQAAVPVKAEPAPAQDDLKFEVASVRALDPVEPNTNGGFRVAGGPGSKDPEHIRYTQAPIFQILTRTFEVQADQLIGPSWVMQQYGAERFEILANVPPGATAAQANVMLLNLVKERFHLAYHVEKRNLDVYELVLAKGGAKVHDAEIPSEMPIPTPGQPSQTFKGADGYPNLPPGWPSGVGVVAGGDTSFFFAANGKTSFHVAPANALFSGGKLQIWSFAMRMVTMPRLVMWIQDAQGLAHIVDRTGLTGQYDLKLRFSNGGSAESAEASEPAPNLAEALEQQLGLKLQKTKAPLDVIVIDHIDRTPVEN